MYKQTPQILILVGAPGSGKSSFAKYFLRTETHWVRVSRDDFRAMQYEGTRASDQTEMIITAAIDASINAFLLKKLNVIIDATHCKMEYINQIITKFNHLASIQFKVFDVPYPELLERCTAREAASGKEIPVKVLDGYVKQFELLKSKFNFETIPCKPIIFEPLLQPNDKASAFLCDLDGTIAKANGRTMFNPTDDEVMSDSPIWPCIKVLQSLATQHKIIFVSGREDTTYEATKKWIQKYVFTNGQDIQLLMRAKGDYRRDSIIKKEILHQNILPHYNVQGVFDDRLQVVRECWNKEHIYCFNVNQLLEEF
jgi:predicted kinase